VSVSASQEKRTTFRVTKSSEAVKNHSLSASRLTSSMFSSALNHNNDAFCAPPRFIRMPTPERLFFVKANFCETENAKPFHQDAEGVFKGQGRNSVSRVCSLGGDAN
jgi:hypothetical protein